MNKLSVVVSAYNEEENLKHCLESVKWADEIIVVDNESTDKTVEIAKKFTNKIYTRKNNIMLNINKNFGFTKATNDWILCLDSDEKVSNELRKEIEEKIKSDPGPNGYKIPRKNLIFGKWIQHTGFYPDFQIRLFRKGFGEFEEINVHEQMTISGDIGELTEAIVHNNYETVTQFLRKHTTVYGPNEAEARIKTGYVFNYLDCIRMPFNEFLSRYFAREGYKDGFHGLMISMLLGFYHLVIFTFIWEKQGFKDPPVKNMTDDLVHEVRKIYKDLSYWFYTTEMKKVKDPLNKALLRIKRVIS